MKAKIFGKKINFQQQHCFKIIVIYEYITSCKNYLFNKYFFCCVFFHIFSISDVKKVKQKIKFVK